MQVTKSSRNCGGISLLILSPRFRWVWVGRLSLQPLYPQRNSLRYPLCWGWFGPRTIWMLFGEDKYACPCLDDWRKSRFLVINRFILYYIILYYIILYYIILYYIILYYIILYYIILKKSYSIPMNFILNLLVVEQLHIFLTFGTIWRWMISYTFQPLYIQRNSPPFDHWRTGVPRSPCRSSGEQKIFRYCSQSSTYFPDVQTVI